MLIIVDFRIANSKPWFCVSKLVVRIYILFFPDGNLNLSIVANINTTTNVRQFRL